MCFLNIINVVTEKRDELFFYIAYNKTKIKSVSAKFRFFNEILNNEIILYKNSAINDFCRAQKLYHTMTKYIRLKRANKMDIDEDLSCSPLSDYKSKLKIDIIQNNNIFTFLLRDLHTIWLNSLTYSSNMIPDPQRPKNPYNNIEFTATNLYNIYFSLLLNGFRINRMIHSHFSQKLSYSNFMYDNTTYLLENALKDEIKNLSDISCYSIIRDLKLLYPERTKRLYYDNKFPDDIKELCVKRIRKLINYYILILFTDSFDSSPVLYIKHDYYKQELIKEFKKIQNFIFCRPYISIEYHNNKKKQKIGYYFEKEYCVLYK